MRLVAMMCFGLVVGLTGCAVETARPPELAQASSAIRAAEQAGGREDFSASMYLDLAGEELGRARERLRANDVDGARGWALRASADASLAMMLARELDARSEAQRRWDEVSDLEDQLGRPSLPVEKQINAQGFSR